MTRGILVGLVSLLAVGALSAQEDRLVLTTQSATQMQQIFEQHIRSEKYRYHAVTGYPLRTLDPMEPKRFQEQSCYDIILVRREKADFTNGYWTWFGKTDEQLEEIRKGLDPERGFLETMHTSWRAMGQRYHWVWFEATLPPLKKNPPPPRLADADFAAAAKELGCEEACIRAVCEVESSSSGFLATDRPKILFEAHIFSRRTGGRFDKTHPQLSVPTAAQSRPLYKGGEKEYERLLEAAKLDRRAALESASWGRFQIMGFNHKAAGFESVEEFVNAMNRSEREHLTAFVKFLEAKKLTAALREKRWEDFARGYNGAGFKANRYDEKLAAAYRKHKEGK